MVGQSVRCRSFVGRQKELAALVEARKSLGKSSGSFALVSGDAGIGKTRLLAEFNALSHERRARNIVNAECPQRAGRTFGPIRYALRALLPSVKLEAVDKNVVRALAQIIPDDIAALQIPDASGTTLEKDELFDALFGFLKAVCAKRATVLTIDDIHWADESTLEFLSYVARRINGMRLLIVATYRADELERNEPLLLSISPLFREPSLRSVRLQPLAARELHELIEGTLEGHAAVPPRVVHDIEERSEGNPFFAEELVKEFLERDGHSATPAQLPLSIRATIAARFNRLDPEERAILEYAAVLGHRFDPDVLGLVMGKDRDTVTAALRKARDLNLIVDDAGGRRSCRFRHALTRQTIYEDVPSFQARRLHLQILAALEAQPDADRHVEDLAYHAWCSGDRDRSARYNERAGAAAFALRALPEALACYERALESAQAPDDRARLYERIGSLERLQGRYKQACQAFEEAVAIRLERGEIDHATRIATSLVGQLYNMDNEAALPYAERYLQTHRARMSREPLDHLLVVCARIACAMYDFGAAERYLDGVSDPAKLEPNARLNYLIVQLMRHTYAGNADEWLRYADQVDDLLPHLSPESMIGLENALALTGIYIGTNERIERALALAERLENDCSFRAQRLYMVAVKATYLYQRGDLPAAAKLIEEVIDGANVNTAIRVAAPIALYVASALGDAALWKKFDQSMLAKAREHVHDPDCSLLLGAHAGFMASQGAVPLAQDDLRLVLETLAFGSPEMMFVLINSSRYLPVSELGRVVELTKVAARHAGGTVARATDTMVRAIIAERLGKTQEAVALGADAAAKYANLGWSLLEAAALELAAKDDEARAIYKRCGAVADLKRMGSTRPSATGTLAELTTREREIAILVAGGDRNEEIAKRLDVATKTVEKHLSSVFRKLKLRSRAQLVALVSASTGNGVAAPRAPAIYRPSGHLLH